jgi:diguanylate cyclase (GGDEF)-like protein
MAEAGTRGREVGFAPTPTADDRATATSLVRTIVRGAFVAVVLLAALASLIATLIVDPLLDGAPLWQQALAEAVAIVFVLPVVLWFTVIPRVTRRGIDMRTETLARERELRADSVRRDLDARLGRAFELAESEVSALDVVDRALHTIVPTASVELLLAADREAGFSRAVASSPDGVAPGCPVGSPDACPATRRAATLTFEDSDAVDACPRLREHDRGGCSAVCVPVAVMGHAVGVLHAIGPASDPPDAPTVQSLQTLANQAGNRLGLLRMMTETRRQAATDQLTGLQNRRMLEPRLRALVATATPFAIVMADLDHFKLLNDTHGHESGDQALRVFARALTDTLRDDDIVCRWGGEEFTIVLPGVDADEAVAATERVREALAIALVDGTTPRFTASFGVTHTDEGSAALEDLLRRADQALYAAKEAGRNRTFRSDVAARATVDETGR